MIHVLAIVRRGGVLGSPRPHRTSITLGSCPQLGQSSGAGSSVGILLPHVAPFSPTDRNLAGARDTALRLPPGLKPPQTLLYAPPWPTPSSCSRASNRAKTSSCSAKPC